MSKTKIITWSIIAALLGMVSLVFIWLKSDFFNTANFSSKAKSVLQSETVVNALSSEITENALKGKPAVQAVAGDTLQSVISGFVRSERFGTVIEKLAASVQSQATSQSPQSVTIDLTGVKNVIESVANAINSSFNTGESATGTIPDQIVLVEGENIPELYPLGQLLWIGPVCAFLSLIIVAYIAVRNYKTQLAYALKSLGFSFAILSLLSALIISSLSQSFTLQTASENLRVVADEFYKSFTASLLDQLYVLTVLGVLAIIAGFWIAYKSNHPQKQDMPSSRKTIN